VYVLIYNNILYLNTCVIKPPEAANELYKTINEVLDIEDEEGIIWEQRKQLKEDE